MTANADIPEIFAVATAQNECGASLPSAIACSHKPPRGGPSLPRAGHCGLGLRLMATAPLLGDASPAKCEALFVYIASINNHSTVDDTLVALGGRATSEARTKAN